jgi:type I restriction enzyme S subunit
MAGEWRQARFGEIAQILPGKYIPASDYDPAGGYLIYGSNSVMGRVRVPLYEGPIIAFARIGSNCGATMYSATPCWINNNAAGIRAKTGCDTRFLYYWMQSFDFAQIREGSGQPYISDRTLKEQVLILPPLPEQRAIAHILGTLDDKIELNRRMSQTLEAMARALFKAWFVDFEPVRAKMEGRWQRGQSLPGLPAHLYDLFPDRLVDSELGEIPEGWEVVTLPEVIEVNPSRPLRKGEVASYLDMVNMPTRGTGIPWSLVLPHALKMAKRHSWIFWRTGKSAGALPNLSCCVRGRLYRSSSVIAWQGAKLFVNSPSRA